MKYRLYIVLFILLVLPGCAHQKGPKDKSGQIKAVCMNVAGKGRFIHHGRKVVFDYETLFEPERLSYAIQLSFPFRGTELIKTEFLLDSNKVKYESSFERRLLRETDVNPALLDYFKRVWTDFFKDMLILKGHIESKSAYSWTSKGENLVGIGRHSKIKYSNFSSGYFARKDMEIFLSGKDKLKLELIVRECLESSTEPK